MTRVLLGFAALILLALLTIRLIYGGGNQFPTASFPADTVTVDTDETFQYPEPFGDIAVEGQDVYFTVHPATRPQGNKLLRLRDGVAFPFPDGASQQKLLTAPLAIALDGRQRLWVVDHGQHGREPARLMAFDTESGNIVHQHVFSREIAPLGSLLSDLAIDTTRERVFIADASLIRRNPAVIVYDIESQTATRRFEGVVALTSAGRRMTSAGERIAILGGLVSHQPGLDSVALDESATYLYLGAGANDGVYRVSVDALSTRGPDSALTRFGDKPQSGDLVVDRYGSVFVADVGNPGVIRIGGDRRAHRYVDNPNWRWPAALTRDDDGALWLAETDLPSYLAGARPERATPYRLIKLTSALGN